MAAPNEHRIFPLRKRNPRIPVSNRFHRFERFDPLNMFENGDNEVNFGVQKVYQGFKYSHDPTTTYERHPPPPLEILPPPQPPLVHDLSPPTSPPLVENGFRNFLAGWVVLFLGIGFWAFLLLQR